MINRENYYILLDLSPTVTDWPSIETHIAKKRLEWSTQKLTGALKLRNAAAQNLKSITVITSLMEDETLRLDEAKQAINILKAVKESELKELDELIKRWNSEHYSHDELDVLCKQFKGSLPKDDIEERLQSFGITKRTLIKKTPPKQPQLIPSIAKSIATELGSLNYNTLYHFLTEEGDGHFSRTSSCKALSTCANQIYNETKRIGKTDPRSTTVSSLAGKAKSVFGSTDEKLKYDNTLANENLVHLDKLLEVVGRNGYLDDVGMVAILTRAKELHINEKAAAKYIEDYASKRKWLVIQPTKKIKWEVRICGLCDHINPRSTKHCQKCSTPLDFPCPKCGKKVKSHYSICGHCGFNTGDAPLINSLLKKASNFIKTQNYDEAKEYLLKCEEYSPDWPGVKTEFDKIASFEKLRLERIAEIRDNVSKRAMCEAQKLIDKYFPTLEDKRLNGLATKIKLATDDASRKFRASQEMMNLDKTEEAYLEFGRCLQVCADYPWALLEQKSIAPLAPGKVKVNVEKTAMHISWEKSPSAGDLSYVVVRKTNKKPLNLSDGMSLIETKSTEYYDCTTKNGLVYFYGVFCKRGTGVSKERSCSVAVIRCDEVTDIESEVNATSILLNWKRPKNCNRVEVWQQEEKIPPYQGRGKRHVNLGKSFLDNTVTNGKQYGYLVVACYDGIIQGNYHYSNGVGILATASNPPAPLESFKLTELANGKVELSWLPSELTGDGLSILSSDENPKLEKGLVISKNTLKSKGRLLIPGTSDNRYIVDVSHTGTFFFTPLTVRDEILVTGKCRSISFFSNVSNICSAYNGHTLSLTWDWPDNFQQVVVAWAHDKFITSLSNAGSRQKIAKRTEYMNQGRFELTLERPQKLYLSLFVKAEDGTLSTGIQHLETMGMDTVIKYRLEVTKRTFFRRPKEAVILVNSNEPVKLKNIMVYKGAGEPPLTQQEGSFVKKISFLSLEEQSNQIKITEEDVLQKNDFIKLFFSESENAKGIRLMPAEAKNLEYR